MTRTIVTCDECGEEKKDNGWWSLVFTDNTYIVCVQGKNEDLTPRIDLCSEQCLQRAEARLREEMKHA